MDKMYHPFSGACRFQRGQRVRSPEGVPYIILPRALATGRAAHLQEAPLSDRLLLPPRGFGMKRNGRLVRFAGSIVRPKEIFGSATPVEKGQEGLSGIVKTSLPSYFLKTKYTASTRKTAAMAWFGRRVSVLKKSTVNAANTRRVITSCSTLSSTRL